MEQKELKSRYVALLAAVAAAAVVLMRVGSRCFNCRLLPLPLLGLGTMICVLLNGDDDTGRRDRDMG